MPEVWWGGGNAYCYIGMSLFQLSRVNILQDVSIGEKGVKSTLVCLYFRMGIYDYLNIKNV